MSETIASLTMRIAVCKGIIHALQNDAELLADPRQPAALAEYKQQLATLENMLLETKAGQLLDGPAESLDAVPIEREKPAPTVVQLKTARIFPQVGRKD